MCVFVCDGVGRETEIEKQRGRGRGEVLSNMDISKAQGEAQRGLFF